MDYYTQLSQNVKHFFQISRNYFLMKKARHCEEGEARRGNSPELPEALGDCHASVRTGSQ